MRLCWWREIRVSGISDENRKLFERFGETVLQIVLTSGLNPKHGELSNLFNNETLRTEAEKWLTEQADIHERRENRLETVEWAILIIFIVSLTVESIQLIHDLGFLK